MDRARKDAQSLDDRYPVRLEIELSEWESQGELLEFLRYIRSSANGGHSFLIAADESADPPGKMFGRQRAGVVCSIDGDGSDKIGRIWVNGELLR